MLSRDKNLSFLHLIKIKIMVNNKNRDDLNNLLPNLTFIKTILMILVILGHSVHFWTGGWFASDPIFQSKGLAYICDWLNSFHIYAFVLISGYIFAYKMRGGGYTQYIPFILNKARRLIVPYVFAAIVWVMPVSQYFFKWSLATLVKKYVLCISPSQLWFLWMLFGTFVIVRLLWRFFSKKPSGWFLSIFFYVIGIIGPSIIPNVFCIWLACQYVPFFYIGIWIREQQENINTINIMKVPVWIWLFLDGILFIINIVVSMKQITIPGLDYILDFALHIVGAIMAVVILHKIASAASWKDNSIIKSLSRCSMPMYLFHQQIIYFCIVAMNGKVNPWLNAGINFVVALIASFAVSNVLMSWKTTRFLIGEK